MSVRIELTKGEAVTIELTKGEAKTLRFYVSKALRDAEVMRAAGTGSKETVDYLKSIIRKIDGKTTTETNTNEKEVKHERTINSRRTPQGARRRTRQPGSKTVQRHGS